MWQTVKDYCWCWWNDYCWKHLQPAYRFAWISNCESCDKERKYAQEMRRAAILKQRGW